VLDHHGLRDLGCGSLRYIIGTLVNAYAQEKAVPPVPDLLAGYIHDERVCMRYAVYYYYYDISLGPSLDMGR